MQVTCPACQKTMQSKADLSGKSVKCGCGHAFVVPAAKAAPATSAGKIAVACSCGKSLQVPATAAGKAVKCPCGQVVPIPAAAPAQRTAPQRTAPSAKPVHAMAGAVASPQARRPAPQPAALSAAPNPFGDISDDEWSNMVQAHAPKKVDESKPKEKSAAAKMLEQARQETGQGNSEAMDSALGFLNKTRGILVGLGILCLVRSVITYWLLTSMVDAMAGDDPDAGRIMKLVVTVFCGIDIGIAVLYIFLGFMVSIFPMTCAITALVVFTLVELAGFIVDPGSLLSIRGWIFRIAIFGGLIQGINNAAYFRHLKAEEKAAKKQRGG